VRRSSQNLEERRSSLSLEIQKLRQFEHPGTRAKRRFLLDDIDREFMELMAKMHLEDMLKEFERLRRKMLVKVQRGFERLLAVPGAGRSQDWNTAYNRYCFLEIWFSHFGEMKMREALERSGRKELSQDDGVNAVFGDSREWAKKIWKELK
jgi:hypothetical protein